MGRSFGYECDSRGREDTFRHEILVDGATVQLQVTIVATEEMYVNPSPAGCET